MTELKVRRAGMLTSVQDLGRWGFQSSGVPVAGAMDLPALRLGNAMLGNPEGAAALEVTLLGPELEVCGGGAAVFAGADLGFSVNGRAVGSWRVVELKSGDVISFTGPKNGCRGNLCFAGGVGVPLVMNSRSTYMRAKIGGFEGRALKNGDVITTGEPSPLWKRLDGFTLPPGLNPALPARRAAVADDGASGGPVHGGGQSDALLVRIHDNLRIGQNGLPPRRRRKSRTAAKAATSSPTEFRSEPSRYRRTGCR